MNDDDTFTISYDDITVNLDSISNTGKYSITCDTNVSDITFSNTYIDSISPTITIDTTTSDSGSIYNVLDTFIDPEEVDRMCKEYPALSKVWRNFKSVYDMTLQDYKGKKEQGEIDDPIPF